MRPLQLTHGSRPVTQVLYGTDGDVLFTASKDSSAAMWFTHNGEVGDERRDDRAVA
jgi:translation initiation factor 3 subunit I